MTDRTRHWFSFAGIVAAAVVLTALLTLSGFETTKAHDASLARERTERIEQYKRLICINESIIDRLDQKPVRVCP